MFNNKFYKQIDGVVMRSPLVSTMQKSLEYLSSKHTNNFLLEKGNDGRLYFLHINIFCEKGEFVTKAYQKMTFSGVYTNFTSSYLKPIKLI